jgi:RNA polymerase sigma-70 factor (ECF subfamily)
MSRAVRVGTVRDARSLQSFDEFFLEHRDRLFHALWLVTRNRHEAEELAQDAFLKVWECWDRIGGLDDPTGYLFRAAMNLFRNRLRRGLLGLRRAVRIAPPDDQMRTIEDRDEVVRALGRLTRSQRGALVLTDLVGMTSKEAGEMLGVRPSTVRVLAARARTALREQMGETDA